MTKRYDKTCPGEREAIIDKKTWDKAQEFPAAELEDLLLCEIGSMLAEPEVIAGMMPHAAEPDEHGKDLKLPVGQPGV